MQVVESRFPGVPGHEMLHAGLPLGANRQRLNVVWRQMSMLAQGLCVSLALE